LGERLRTARRRAFVGRSAELALFRSALAGAPGSGAVLYLHGPGGVGKTTLLRRFADESRDAGRPVVEFDCRVMDPSPARFQADAAQALSKSSAVLLVDTFEQCHGLEEWLRDQFLPRLPGGAVVVLASREAPSLAWVSDVAWSDVLRVAALGDLAADDAEALLRARGVEPRMCAAVLAFAGGHPLTLSLAAALATADAGTAAVWAPTPDVLTAVLNRLVGKVPTPAHRLALEVSAHTLTTTEDLLRAAVGEDAAGSVFAWLRNLPFVESDRHGLFMHELVRDVLDRDLRWRDPQRYEEMHRSVGRYLLERVRVSTRVETLPAMRSLDYLRRHGPMARGLPALEREAEVGDVHEDVPRAADRAAVRRMAISGEGAASASIVDFWLRRQPEAFHVYRRSATGEPVAFMAGLRLDRPRDDELATDPVVAAAWRHVRRMGSGRSGEHVAFARFLVDPAAHHRISPVTYLMQLRIAADSIRADRLAWSFVATPDPALWRASMSWLGQQQLDETPLVDGRRYTLFGHDVRLTPMEITFERTNFGRIAPTPVEPYTSPGVVVLSHVEFDTAVRRALRDWHRPDDLATNPLLRGRLFAGHGAGSRGAVESLRRLLTEVVEGLRDDPRESKLHRAVTATYFCRTPTQVAAAQHLGLPFSTYRRHLRRGVDRVCERLWRHEVDSAGLAPPGPAPLTRN